MHMKKVYTTANANQLHLKDRCLESAKQYMQDYQHVEITHETIYEWDGTTSFIISVNAKPNTGLMCLLNKSWIINISRRGTVRSKRIGVSLAGKSEPKLKVNKHLLFIA